MKIAIAGYGIEGKSSYGYFRAKYPEATMIIADENDIVDKPDGALIHIGANVFSEQLDDVDLVIRAPSIAPNKIRTKGTISSLTNEFFANCKAPIIGVTGTKGKGTTCSLICSILKAAGKTVHLVGNIGVPALELLDIIKPTDYVIYELSSFQLWDLKMSPHVAVVLMIEPDHIDVHGDFAGYINAKKNIRRYQTASDICLYHPTNKYSNEIAMANVVAPARRYGIIDDGQAYEKDGYFYIQNRKLCSVSCLKLPGKHNIENACAAISAVNALEIEISDADYAKGLENFGGLDHRLKYVANKNGVKYYDDSISTTPGSAIAAIRSFSAPQILLLGGRDKGGDYRKLAVEIANNDLVKKVVLFGDSASKLEEVLLSAGIVRQRIIIAKIDSMDELVDIATIEASNGDVVILSPAASGRDMFDSYADRGDKFVSAVEKIA